MTDLTTLQSLRDRVAQADKWDRELDADVAEAGGIRVEREHYARYTGEWSPYIYDWMGCNKHPLPYFTASIDAALAWVGLTLPGWALLKLCQYHSGDEPIDMWGCRLYKPGTPNPEEVGKGRPPVVSKWLWEGADAPTPALAIILAALDALIAKEKTDDQA
jgi:hypothetical protein